MNYFLLKLKEKIYQYNKIKNCPIRRSDTHIIIKNSSISKTHVINESNEEKGIFQLRIMEVQMELILFFVRNILKYFLI